MNSEERYTIVDHIIRKIKEAQSLILSTHRECDGDGLGSEIGLYHALIKIGKPTRILNLDHTAAKYNFLNPHQYVDVFEAPHDPIEKTDLALIFDTNDSRMLGTLYEVLKQQCKEIIFIDHHPILNKGPKPTHSSIIDTEAASTGEIVYDIIKKLNIPLDKNIAKALYTSIAFDTQVFRYVRNSPKSHHIAVDLLKYEHHPDEIHRQLFGHQSIQKFQFLSEALKNIEYFSEGHFALIKIKKSELDNHQLTAEDSRDLIDMVMNIESLEAAALLREDSLDKYKVSLRSKGRIEVLSIAESLGGGGHLYTAGAFYSGKYSKLKEKTITALKKKIQTTKANNHT